MGIHMQILYEFNIPMLNHHQIFDRMSGQVFETRQHKVLSGQKTQCTVPCGEKIQCTGLLGQKNGYLLPTSGITTRQFFVIVYKDEGGHGPLIDMRCSQGPRNGILL